MNLMYFICIETIDQLYNQDVVYCIKLFELYISINVHFFLAHSSINCYTGNSHLKYTCTFDSQEIFFLNYHLTKYI